MKVEFPPGLILFLFMKTLQDAYKDKNRGEYDATIE